MKRTVTNVAASVRERLANRARETGEEFGLVLRRYLFERFLHRLASSPAARAFVLKGAMLFQLWSNQPYRATADLDLHRKGSTDDETLRDDLLSILSARVEDDGVVFDAASLTLEPIRIDDDHGGRRAHVVGMLERARERLQIDIGMGDAVWPAPSRVEYPSLLAFTPPRILAYARETVIAEKFEAMVLLGPRNSRIKDFFDVHHLAATFAFEADVLSEAIRRTFARRHTPVPTQLPVGLTREYWGEPIREAQVRAFARRARLDTSGRTQGLLPLLTLFFRPLLQHLADRATLSSWPPGGPWQALQH